MKRSIFAILAIILSLSLLLTACAAQPTEAPAAPPATAEPTEAPAAPPATEVPTEAPAAPPAPANPDVILATTTSTRDSGLLDYLLPIFQEETGYVIKMVAVGTGEALKMGEEGNADVLLVHAPASEVTFMEGGFGKDRYLIMHNDFVIVGPADDPAGIKGSADTVTALKAIAEAQAPFTTRGDDSGTHKMELKLWAAAEITPEGEWYLNTGQGMGDTLRIASEKYAYTLTDRATYLALKDTLDLDILFEGDKALLNIYHVITVNPEKWTNMNYDGAKAFADWLVTDEVQKMVETFGVDKYGQPLFFPDAGNPEY